MDGEARQILAIPLDQIDESPSNPRKYFDERYLKELAEDLKQQGQLQAARVRPKGDRYELVFGACRLRALRLAGLPTLDATVHEYSDLDALAVQLRENSKRLDVHPLEEADGYRELRDVHHLSVDEIAAKVSKEPGYIRHRLQYCALGPKAREHFLSGKLTNATALLVARIPVEALREQAAEEIVKGSWGQGPMNARAAGNHVRGNYMLRLASARPRSAPVDPQTAEGVRALLARYPAEQLARTLGYSRTVLARALAGKPLRPETAEALRGLVAQGKALDLQPASAPRAA